MSAKYAIGIIALTKDECKWILWNIPSRSRTDSEESLYEKVLGVVEKDISQISSPEMLRKRVCDILGKRESEVLHKSRGRSNVYIRVIIAELARECFPDLTCGEIASLVNRDHSDISHYRKMMAKEVVKLSYLKVKSILKQNGINHKI